MKVVLRFRLMMHLANGRDGLVDEPRVFRATHEFTTLPEGHEMAAESVVLCLVQLRNKRHELPD